MTRRPDLSRRRLAPAPKPNTVRHVRPAAPRKLPPRRGR